MTAPVITALYGALNAILNLILAGRVIRGRGTHKVSLGESPEMLALIRGHANNAEFVPLALVMLLLAELCGGDRVVLHAMGGALLLGRVLHPIGLHRRAPNFYRAGGVVLTLLTIAGSAGYVLYLRFQLV